jgi:hypothetical protein
MQTSYGHLTYCTNIHAGENWPDHFKALQKNFPFIKKAISPEGRMGIGLRLSHEASLELVKDAQLSAFKNWLSENNAYVFTMNGFPYGGFHHTKVKDQVHAPDWTTPDRLAYTLRLFQILEALLPEGVDGGISTSPLSYRYWFNSPQSLHKAKETATSQILTVVENLIDINRRSGKLLHLDIEPEPDGVIESGIEFVEWFEKNLLIQGNQRLAEKYQVSIPEAEELIKQHLRLCYDVCHFAIGYEPHDKMIKDLSAKGIKIGKFQISAALKAEMGNVKDREPVKNAFSAFNETTYLHQVVARKDNGDMIRYRDLPEALADYQNSTVKEWRAHFHVPVSVKDFGILKSTQPDIVEVLKLQMQDKLTDHLEVETYTWEVLPEALKLPLQESITGELKWVTAILSA